MPATVAGTGGTSPAARRRGPDPAARCPDARFCHYIRKNTACCVLAPLPPVPSRPRRANRQPGDLGLGVPHRAGLVARESPGPRPVRAVPRPLVTTAINPSHWRLGHDRTHARPPSRCGRSSPGKALPGPDNLAGQDGVQLRHWIRTCHVSPARPNTIAQAMEPPVAVRDSAAKRIATAQESAAVTKGKPSPLPCWPGRRVRPARYRRACRRAALRPGVRVHRAAGAQDAAAAPPSWAGHSRYR